LAEADFLFLIRLGLGKQLGWERGRELVKNASE